MTTSTLNPDSTATTTTTTVAEHKAAGMTTVSPPQPHHTEATITKTVTTVQLEHVTVDTAPDGSKVIKDEVTETVTETLEETVMEEEVPEGEGEEEEEDSEEVKRVKGLSVEEKKAYITEKMSFAKAEKAKGEFETAIEAYISALPIAVDVYGSEYAPEVADLHFDYATAILAQEQDRREITEKVTQQAASANAEQVAPVKQALEAKIRALSEENSSEESQDTTPSSETPVAASSTAAASGSANDAEEEEEDEDDAEDEDAYRDAWNSLEIARISYESQAQTPDIIKKKAETLLCLGDISMEKEAFETALRDYASALEIKKAYLSANDRELAEVYFKVALAQEYDQVYSAAIKSINEAVKILEACRDEPAGKGKDAAISSSSSGVEDGLEAVIQEVKAKLDDLKRKLEEIGDAQADDDEEDEKEGEEELKSAAGTKRMREDEVMEDASEAGKKPKTDA